MQLTKLYPDSKAMKMKLLERNTHEGKTSASYALLRVVALFIPLCMATVTVEVSHAYQQLASTTGYEQMSFAQKSRTQGPYAIFRLKGADGYQIVVGGSSKGVTLIASRRQESVIYLDRNGRGGLSGIQAHFGRLGQVSVRFQPIGKLGEKQKGQSNKCSLRGYSGEFTGNIKFRGERNFTSIRRQRIDGFLVLHRRPRCSNEDDRALADKQVPRLTALQTRFPLRGLRFLSFDVLEEPVARANTLPRYEGGRNWPKRTGHSVTFIAEMIEDRGRLLILRKVATTGQGGNFEVVNNRTGALVSPPFPFIGKAEFTGCGPSRALWQGSLRVSFPGTGTVKLAGKSFDAALKQQGKCSQEKSGSK